MFVNRKKLALFTVMVICFAFDFSMAAAESDFRQKSWTKIETKHTIIRYKSDQDLLKFHKSVKYGHDLWNRFSSFHVIPVSEVKRMMIQKTDAVFERVQEILDMQKKFKTRTFINIYPDARELRKAYSMIYKEKCSIRAWYRFKNNTVYINADDIDAGMLAHELAHGIIDRFLLVKPPSETAEILARYVDSHL